MKDCDSLVLDTRPLMPSTDLILSKPLPEPGYTPLAEDANLVPGWEGELPWLSYLTSLGVVGSPEVLRDTYEASTSFHKLSSLDPKGLKGTHKMELMVSYKATREPLCTIIIEPVTQDRTRSIRARRHGTEDWIEVQTQFYLSPLTPEVGHQGKVPARIACLSLWVQELEDGSLCAYGASLSLDGAGVHHWSTTPTLEGQDLFLSQLFDHIVDAGAEGHNVYVHNLGEGVEGFFFMTAAAHAVAQGETGSKE